MRTRIVRRPTPPWRFVATWIAIVAFGMLGAGLATPERAFAAAGTAPHPAPAIAPIASSTSDGSGAGSDLTAPSAPSSFWVVPSLLSAVVIIVGLISRQRERARDRARDG